MLKASLCSSNLKSALDKQNAQIFTPVYLQRVPSPEPGTSAALAEADAGRADVERRLGLMVPPIRDLCDPEDDGPGGAGPPEGTGEVAQPRRPPV